jgi:adenine-specific DNA-methyltransferase
MVDESLITYLTNSLVKDDKDEKQAEDVNQKLHHLFAYNNDIPAFTVEEKNNLINAIDTCKILDPACGSGAFPMGILQKLVFVLSKLDSNNKQWKQKQLDKVKSDRNLALQMQDDKAREATLLELDKREEDITKAFDQNNHELDFARKLYLIENCIYGVDKQPVAIQISKLRFFIALIVDQKTEQSNLRNRGIRPLPNLETKFVAADTLVSIEKPNGLLVNLVLDKQIKEKEAEIHKVREKHFRARTPETKEKYRLLDTQYRNELAELLEQDGFPKDATKKLAGWNPYDQNKYADFFDPMWMFEIENGFDIVIGNPPYVSYYSNTGSELSESERKYFVRAYESVKKINDRINSMNLFIERGNKLLKTNGVLSYIVNKTFAVLPSYNETRKYFLGNAKIEYLITNLDPFDAIVDCVVFGSIRNKTIKPYKLKWLKGGLEDFKIKGSEQIFKNPKLELHFSENQSVVSLIEKANSQLSDLITVNRGVNIGGCFEQFLSDEKLNSNYHKYLAGTRAIKRFSYKWEKEKDSYFIFDTKLEQMLRSKGATLTLGDHNRYLVPRLFIPESGQYLMAAYCEERIYSAYGLMVGTTTSDKDNLKYTCALLNSTLFTFYAIEKEILRKGNKATPHIGVKGLNAIPVYKPNAQTKKVFINLVNYVSEIAIRIDDSDNSYKYELFCNVSNACVYELYFEEEMKKAEVDILALVEKDLKAVDKLDTQKAIDILYKKWQEPKNEVRNRLLLMATRCPKTIGIIESNV